MEKEPIVSVIMPAYGCEDTISQAIQSVLCQQIPLELIVINDCSPDNLDQVMELYQENPTVIYIHNQKNLGAAGSRNLGVSMAKGEYVAFLDADDWWEEGKLKKQIEQLKKTGAVLCGTARELVTPEGAATGRVIPVKERISYKSLLRHNSINCSSVLVKTSVIRQFPMDHEDSHEDYITWLKILNKYEYACGINEPLLKYRLSNKGKSGNKLHSAGMTFRVYRYLGFGPVKSLYCFCCYALHGVWKYFGPGRPGKNVE